MLFLGLNKFEQANSVKWNYIVFAAGMSTKLTDELILSNLSRMPLFEFLPLSSVLVFFKDTLVNRIFSSSSKIYRNMYFRNQSQIAMHLSKKSYFLSQTFDSSIIFW